MTTIKDLEMAIFVDDAATKIKMNEDWLEEQMTLYPVIDQQGDPLILSMEYMGMPVEFDNKVEDFELAST